jgi:hypothetical protein
MSDFIRDGLPVIVCTEYKGVFFGYTKDDLNKEPIRLTAARCAIQFGTTGGILELAEKGPTSRSKIGARAPGIRLRKVSAVIELSPQAVVAWEKA